MHTSHDGNMATNVHGTSQAHHDQHSNTIRMHVSVEALRRKRAADRPALTDDERAKFARLVQAHEDAGIQSPACDTCRVKLALEAERAAAVSASPGNWRDAAIDADLAMSAQRANAARCKAAAAVDVAGGRLNAQSLVRRQALGLIARHTGPDPVRLAAVAAALGLPAPMVREALRSCCAASGLLKRSGPQQDTSYTVRTMRPTSGRSKVGAAQLLATRAVLELALGAALAVEPRCHMVPGLVPAEQCLIGASLGIVKPGTSYMVRAIELCRPAHVGDVRELRAELDRAGTTHVTVGGAIHIYLWSAILRRAKRYEWRAGGTDTGNPSARSCLRGHVLLLQCAQTGEFLQATAGRIIEIRAGHGASGGMPGVAGRIDDARDRLDAAFMAQHDAFKALTAADLEVTDTQAPGLRQVISPADLVGDSGRNGET